MSLNDDQIVLSNTPPHTSFPFIDPDDIDDDDDMDDDSLDSPAEIQSILQTFGTNDYSTLTIDYFDSRRYEIMYEIMNIERQFDQLKTILYDESVLLIDRKLISVQNEEAPEYQDELKKLYDEMKLRLEIAKQRRHIELQALEHSSQSELLSLEQTLENDKFLLYHHIREDTEYKIDELETLKSKTQLCANILQEMFPQDQQQQQIISPNKKRFESPESIKQTMKKRRLNPPNGPMKTIDKDNLAIFYQLSDIDVIEDWALIQTSLQQASIILDETDDESERSDIDDNINDLVLMPTDETYLKQEEFEYD